MRFRALNTVASFALTFVGMAAFACSSSDNSGGKASTGGASSGGAHTGGGSGGVVSGGGSGGVNTGGVGQGGMAGFLAGGTAGVSSGGFAGVSAGGSAGAINWGPYPPGPYGHDVGTVIADLNWEGYVNETGAVSSDQMPYIDYGTDAMRKSGKAYGLIHVSSFF